MAKQYIFLQDACNPDSAYRIVAQGDEYIGEHGMRWKEVPYQWIGKTIPEVEWHASEFVSIRHIVKE
jgi:hypothetical protein